ncbi:SIR2 family protein [candidate division NPL-UPA2 bacterium]|nr:SIR2 family protein [candidate division NPL-UPA2 bacterium]
MQTKYFHGARKWGGEVAEARKTRDIIFLGSGASASEGAPLQSRLFEEYFYDFENKNKTGGNKSKRLSTFFKVFFGIDIGLNEKSINDIKFPSFEEVLGMIEIALNRDECFKLWSGSLSELRKTREDLVFLIATVLQKKLKSKGKYHKKLIERLKEEKKLSKTGFVSLNYDILIDNALLKCNYNLDYGVEFVKERTSDNSRRNKEKVVLCKPHGSLNWLYCPTCISLRLTSGQKGAAELVVKSQECTNCKSNVIPIIIPPTFFKVMSNFYLQEVWHKTEKMLRQAERIFFCGYSFPDADLHIKYLLKRAEMYKSSAFEVFIINNHNNKPDAEKESENKRYKRFFKDSEKVTYTDKSFEDFCESDIEDVEDESGVSP